jgi:hypothetical protein
LTTWYTKRRIPCKFSDFFGRFDDFNIYYLLNQQIMKIIGKFGRKIPKLHTTSWFGSIRIPKKFKWFWAIGTIHPT